MDLLNESRKQLASTIAADKDQIIRQAINSVIGDKWSVEDIKGRGEFIGLPDKTEVFKFDGMELIHFMVPRTEIDTSGAGTIATVVQGYRFLNNEVSQE